MINRAFFILIMVVTSIFSDASQANAKTPSNTEPNNKSIAIFHAAIIDDSPAAHGLNKLEKALVDKAFQVSRHSEVSHLENDFYIFINLAGKNSVVPEVLVDERAPAPEGAESLSINKATFKDKPALIISGGDEVGLMYAALETAKKITWSNTPADPFEFVQNLSEQPDVKERAVSMGTFQRRYFESKLHDLKYWENYFDMMAENRLNQFILIFGYKNRQYIEPNFTAPVYPFLFDLSSFPDVKMKGMSKEQQALNTEALHVIIKLAHQRGIEFGVGLWDQIERDKRYLAMLEDETLTHEDLPSNMILGLSTDNLIPYTKVAMRQFFQTFPEIDLVQFRMHWESGIQGEVALKFWKEIFNMLKQENPKLKVEARAKDVPDETLYDGVATGMDFRVATKHWMEQMGMPFHPTLVNKQNQMDRRHGYADMLRYPQRYGFKWRLWNGGTTRVFKWGSPNWVKLFVENSHLYNAAGFEFNEPLYFKMNGTTHNTEEFDLLNQDYQYYTYEFERYWHFYQLFGRLGYNPNTPVKRWEMEFISRFGHDAGPDLMQGLHLASDVLPRIVAASYLYTRFPSPQGWPEMQRMESLPHFALKSLPSDIQQFASPKEEAELILSQSISPRRLPRHTSQWFQKTGSEILRYANRAESALGANISNEAASTLVDIRMLAHLALYHANRLKAAVAYNLYDTTGDLAAFDSAIASETKAVDAYGNMVQAAGDMYASELKFGSMTDLFPGHWNNEHARLVDELVALKSERDAAASTALQQTSMIHIPKQYAIPGERLKLSATLIAPNSNLEASLKLDSGDGNYQTIAMSSTRSGVYSAEIVVPKTSKYLNYYFETKAGAQHGDVLPKAGKASAYKVIVTDDRQPPAVDLQRIDSAPLSKNLRVSARAEDPSGIHSLVLRYRRVTQFEDYQSVEMLFNSESGQYEAEIPAEFLIEKYDLMYFVEAIDTVGNGRMYPDLEIETPYVIVQMQRK